MLLTQELIARKRDGGELEEDEIDAFVTDIATGQVSDAQIAAWCMAVFFRGLTDPELTAMTLAMRDSGMVLTWPGLEGRVVDKHSTGGVGDLVSLVVAPIVAACGGYVPMISGRGLGHTGGTVDKLDSIPGFDTFMGIEAFCSQVRESGLAIVGQSEQFTPADGRMYSVRDTTATVDANPLIVSSILAKKLAEGVDALVLDVKWGNGAFMRTPQAARALAQSLERIAAFTGIRCRSVISDMNQPLSRNAGNALEVVEAIEFLLGGDRAPRLEEVVRRLAVEMILLIGLAPDPADARVQVDRALSSGEAAERFARMIRGQGGPSDLLERHVAILPRAEFVQPVYPASAGTVSSIDTRAIGMAIVELGGGRLRPSDSIRPEVGLSELASVGDTVDDERPLALVHARSTAGAERAATAMRAAYRVGGSGHDDPREIPPDTPPVITEVI